MTVEHLQRIQSTVVRGRRWIVAMDVLVAASAAARRLLDAGALDVLAIGASRGTGPLAELPPDRALCMDVRGSDMMSAIRATEAALDDLPPDLVAAVHRFDPERAARVVRALFSTGAPVAGRPTWGARPAAWQALEDKTVIEPLWDEAGLARAPSEVVPVHAPALAAASARRDEGAGVVWAGDSREGFNGGATATRWIRHPGLMAEVLPYFQAHHDRVRVMPFLEGLPCSVHGIVLPDHVIALRPNEMIVLRRPGQATFQYAGFGTFWDPPEARRAELRAAARRVGELLRARFGYRGAFSLDGVMTAQGFRPTELNPRIGGAMYAVFGREASLDVLNGAMIEGEPLDWRSFELESYLIERADLNRGGHSGLALKVPPESQRETWLTVQGGVAHEVTVDDPWTLHASMGPGPSGGYLRLVAHPDRTPRGPSLAASIVTGLRWADEAWGAGVGEVEAAPDLR